MSAPEVEAALAAADRARIEAFRASAKRRAAWLSAVADGLDAHADDLVTLAGHETRLPEGRLRNELKRTTFQARLFADELAAGSLLTTRIDLADPDWPMGPRPD